MRGADRYRFGAGRKRIRTGGPTLLFAVGHEAIFPALAASRIDQVSVECAGAKIPLDLIALLEGKEVLLGVIDVASDRVETPDEVAATIEQASRFVPVERLYPCTNCGMAPMDRALAVRKLFALCAGAHLLRDKTG